MLRTIVDTKPFSFSDFRRRPARMPALLRAELKAWLKRVNLQFRELGLRMLLANLRGSLTETLPDQPFARARPPG